VFTGHTLHIYEDGVEYVRPTVHTITTRYLTPSCIQVFAVFDSLARSLLAVTMILGGLVIGVKAISSDISHVLANRVPAGCRLCKPALTPLVNTCFEKTWRPATKCMTSAYRRWGIPLKGKALWSGPLATPNSRERCCASWESYDCYKHAPLFKCNLHERVDVRIYLSKIIRWQSYTDCRKFGYRSRSHI
ncbi:unnamed protein product, partial [Oppiella nova]